jgi:hypothetical protein
MPFQAFQVWKQLILELFVLIFSYKAKFNFKFTLKLKWSTVCLLNKCPNLIVHRQKLHFVSQNGAHFKFFCE